MTKLENHHECIYPRGTPISKNLFKNGISRRDFLKRGGLFLTGIGLGLFNLSNLPDKDDPQELNKDSLREAMFYRQLDRGAVQCDVCFRQCRLGKGQRSFCRNKMNIGGRLYNLVHSRPAAVQIDPIEKEPAYHMYPGTEILCFGTAGCNFRCKFCHNWHLSQRSIEEMEYTYDLPPAEAVAIAERKSIPTISFTYNEPTSFYEYVYDIARIAKKKGLNVLFHSNGAMNPEPLEELLKFTDAVTIDLKGFTRQFYENVASAELDPVLRTLKTIKKENRWLEIVNLVIPGLNDDPDHIEAMCLWIKDNLGEDVPLHFSRFFPNYRLTNIASTPVKKLEKAHQIARNSGLKYVTIGNVPGHKHNSTFCPNCDKRIIHRTHFRVVENKVTNGKCAFCGYPIAGIW